MGLTADQTRPGCPIGHASSVRRHIKTPIRRKRDRGLVQDWLEMLQRCWICFRDLTAGITRAHGATSCSQVSLSRSWIACLGFWNDAIDDVGYEIRLIPRRRTSTDSRNHQIQRGNNVAPIRSVT